MSKRVWRSLRTALLTISVCAAGVLPTRAQQPAASSQDATLKPMAKDADPSFEVATIKPNDSGVRTMMGIKLQGRSLSMLNASLVDMIGFAYLVQARQVFEAPKWASEDRFDLVAVPDADGVPNVTQQRTMLKKLLTDRFKLTYHEEKRELPAFVLTESKRGAKLVPTKSEGDLPVTGVRPSADGWTLSLQNGSLLALTNFLQLGVLDRPVVDHTGIAGKFDFTVNFTPDMTQFHGMIPARPLDNPAPDLFTALEQQYGLKLTSEKAMVEVVVVDRAEKPTAN